MKLLFSILYPKPELRATIKEIETNEWTTQAFELETGLTINEPGTLAVKAAVEAAVVELIKEGERKGIWEFNVPYVAPENKIEETK